MKIRTIATVIAAVAIIYVFGGALLNYVIFPETIREAYFPRVGDQFVDQSTGETFRVTRRENGRVWGEFTLQPGAAGPRAHIHVSTPEELRVISGQVSGRFGGEEKHLGPGSAIVIAPGTPHTVFNMGETPATALVAEDGAPELLSLCISQAWGMMNDPRRGLGLLQASLYAPRCDMWVTEVPIWVQRLMFFSVAPTARLLGYRSFYPDYAGHPVDGE